MVYITGNSVFSCVFPCKVCTSHTGKHFADDGPARFFSPASSHLHPALNSINNNNNNNNNRDLILNPERTRK